ncbi:DUF4384 domain-containing protein [Ottowia pentelensis]|uniref:DUF4384 domain-containing protein n=1 Tax=Ottowia pentelensis TaxID=511108 RepID=UPI00362E8447
MDGRRSRAGACRGRGRLVVGAVEFGACSQCPGCCPRFPSGRSGSCPACGRASERVHAGSVHGPCSHAPAPAPLPAARTPAESLQALALGAAADVHVTARPTKAEVVVGKDRLAFSVTSNRAGYVYVFLLDSQGELYMLFPNALDKRNQLTPNQTIELPRASWPMEAGGRQAWIDLPCWSAPWSATSRNRACWRAGCLRSFRPRCWLRWSAPAAAVRRPCWVNRFAPVGPLAAMTSTASRTSRSRRNDTHELAADVDVGHGRQFEPVGSRAS